MDSTPRDTPATLRWALPFATVAVATAARMLLQPLLGSLLPYSFYYLAAAAAAAGGGAGPGLLATVLGAVAAVLAFLAPGQPLSLDRDDVVSALFFMAIAAVVVLITDSLRRARLDAEALAESLRRQRTELADVRLQLNRIADTIDDVFWVCEPRARRMVYANVAYERLWGRRVADLYARFDEWLDGVHPDDRDAVERKFASIDAGGYEAEFRVVRPDGSVRWVRDRGAPAGLSPGGELLVAGIATDVTERRQAEERLHEHTAITSALLQGGLDRIYAVDREGRIVLANPSLVAATGKPLEAILGHRHADLLEPASAAAMTARDEGVMRSGRPEIVEEATPLPGGLRVHLTARTPWRNERGEVAGIVAVGRDITDLKAMEARRAQSEERMTLAQEAAHVGVFDLDVTADRLVATPEMARLFGVGPVIGDVPRTAWWSRIEPRDRERLAAEAQHAIECGQRDLPLRFAVRRGDGTHRLSGAARLVYGDDGAVRRIVGSLWDVTAADAAAVERERALDEAQAARRAAEAASASRDEFVGVLAHELRSPLHACIGWLAVLRRSVPVEPHATEAIRRLERNLEAQAKLVNEVLDVSRLLAGRATIARQPVDVARVVEQALGEQRAEAEARRVRLDVDLAPPASSVLGDAARLGQAIGKLLASAVETAPGDGHVAVRLRDAEGAAVLEIGDVRRDAPAPEGGRPGLGPSIARHLIESHGGSLATSGAAADRGAGYVVALPYGATQPQPASGDSLRGFDLLVVEDDADERDALALNLGTHGAVVRATASAREALEQMTRKLPDAIVSDLSMPGEDGYWLIEQVRRMPGGDAVPAVAVTGMASAQDAVSAIVAGFTQHVTKPIDLDGLSAQLARLLERHRRHPPPSRDPGGERS